MGEIADGLIDGEFDYITGEYIGGPVGYPRRINPNKKNKIPVHITPKLTPQERQAKAIRKELAILIKQMQWGLTSDKEKNKAMNDARQLINLKYGKGWRDGIINQLKPTSEAQIGGEEK